MPVLPFSFAVLLAMAVAQPVDSQNVPVESTMHYADLADLALAAPIAAHIRIDDADALKPREAPNVAAGHRRFLIEATVAALIRGPEGTSRRITYLVDLPNDDRGRPARVRRREDYVIF